MTAPESAIRSILSRFADALARGDAGAAVACFAPDATYSEPPRFAFAGRDAIAAFFAKFAARHHDVGFTVARVLAAPLPNPSPTGRGAVDDPPPATGSAASGSPPLAGEGLGERLAAVEWRFAYTRTSDGERTVFEGMCWLELAADGLIAHWRGFFARVAE